jgi:hypothetical protein
MILKKKKSLIFHGKYVYNDFVLKYLYVELKYRTYIYNLPLICLNYNFILINFILNYNFILICIRYVNEISKKSLN